MPAGPAPPFPPAGRFSRELLEVKARRVFPDAWQHALDLMDAVVDSSHIKAWPEWRRTMYKLDCLYLVEKDKEPLEFYLKTLDDDYRLVIWWAEDKPEEWLAWLDTK